MLGYLNRLFAHESSSTRTCNLALGTPCRTTSSVTEAVCVILNAAETCCSLQGQETCQYMQHYQVSSLMMWSHGAVAELDWVHGLLDKCGLA